MIVGRPSGSLFNTIPDIPEDIPDDPGTGSSKYRDLLLPIPLGPGSGESGQSLLGAGRLVINGLDPPRGDGGLEISPCC